MKISSNRNLLHKLFILICYLIPFFSIGEVYALLSGEITSQNENITGNFKFVKDFIISLILLIGFVDLLRLKSKKSFFFYIFFLFTATIISIINTPRIDPLALLSGIRWILPFFLPFLIFRYITKYLIDHLSLIIFRIFIIHFLLQIFQFFFAAPWYGTNQLGFNLRNPGLFLIPSTSALFSLIVMYYLLYFNKLSKLSVFFILTSILLTASGLGILGFVTISFIYLSSKKKLLAFIIKYSLIIFPIAFLFLLTFFSRGDDYIEKSGGNRLEIFIELLSPSHLLSNNFGTGTNTFAMISDVRILDSTYASIIVNLGLIPFFMAIFSYFYFIIFAFMNKYTPLFAILSLILVAAFFCIITEVFPFNFLAAVAVCYALKLALEVNHDVQT